MPNKPFHRGRLQVNYLQHNTSPQTFKAQVAIGSWAKTPLFSGLSDVTSIIEKIMARGDKDERENFIFDSEDEDELDVEMIVSEH